MSEIAASRGRPSSGSDTAGSLRVDVGRLTLYRAVMLARRAFLTGIASLIAAPRGSEAAKNYRIGLLLNRSPDLLSQIKAFEAKLRDLGYVEGRNVVIERQASDRYEELPDLAARLVGLDPDVIVAYGTAAVMAAIRLPTAIPVVMIAVGDPVSAGFAQSLARPGGRATGISILHAELAGKRMELLKEALPNIHRVAVLWHSRNP
jgi:putative ABC transport system substrate-binding protein